MSILFNQTNIAPRTSFFSTISGGGGGSVPDPLSISTILTQALTVSSINGGSYPPGSGSGMNLVFWADQTNTITDNILSVVSQYSNVIVNNGITITENNTSNAALRLSEGGTYRFDVAGWVCGSGNGTNRVVATRGSNVVYDRSRCWNPVVCAVGSQQFLWDGFQANDVIQIYKNQNNSGTFTSNVDVSATVDEWGSISIYRIA